MANFLTTTKPSPLRTAEYKNVYNKLMRRAAERQAPNEQYEKHHIIPSSLGGSNDSENIVCLTYREHFIAHWLLTKFTDGADNKKMLHALFRMSGQNSKKTPRKICSWQYEVARRANRAAMSGNKPSDETRRKLSKARVGNQNGKGYKHKPEACAAISVKLAGNKNAKGHRHSEEVKARISKSNMEEKHWKSKPVVCLNDSNEFPCASAAARFYGVSRQDVSAVCRGDQKTSKGMKFAYKKALEK